jgi:hypothetical protein
VDIVVKNVEIDVIKADRFLYICNFPHHPVLSILISINYGNPTDKPGIYKERVSWGCGIEVEKRLIASLK